MGSRGFTILCIDAVFAVSGVVLICLTFTSNVLFCLGPDLEAFITVDDCGSVDGGGVGSRGFSILCSDAAFAVSGVAFVICFTFASNSWFRPDAVICAALDAGGGSFDGWGVGSRLLIIGCDVVASAVADGTLLVGFNFTTVWWIPLDTAVCSSSVDLVTVTAVTSNFSSLASSRILFCLSIPCC